MSVPPRSAAARVLPLVDPSPPGMDSIRRPAALEAGGSDRLAIWAVLFVCLAPVIAVGSVVLHASRFGVMPSDIFCFVLFYSLTVLTITVGYHRYYSHRTYECHRVVQFFYLLVGAASIENSVLFWASNHRYHHQHEDTELDPYNIKRGFFWAHMGWIFWRDPPGRTFANAPDLKRDPLVMWQHRWYPVLAIVMGLGAPMAVGALFDRPFAGLFWGGFLRIIVVHHVTYMINSVAHTFGRKTWNAMATARDSAWLAVLSFGEGYHSFHHAFPADYRLGGRWHHFDPGKWWIAALERVGLARRLRRSAALTAAAT